MVKRWERKNGSSENLITKLSRSLGISEVLATVLVNRNITNEEEIERFLHPDLNRLPSPFLIDNMDKAVRRVILAIKRHEKIMLYGDYDVDGITSISVVYLYLRAVGANVNYYIPSRLKEGYGLNIDSIKRFLREGYSLLITLDCGISNNMEISYAKQRGMDTIIVDHHEIPETKPPAFAILNPKDSDNKEINVLAGVGVAFNLVMALRSTMKKEGFFNYIKMPNLKQYLDLVALGTIADIVPFTGENRIIVSNGLKVLEHSERYGIKAIKEVASLSHDSISVSDVSFRIAPRINAAGRLDDPAIGVQLLTTDNPLLATRLASTLDKINSERQLIEQRIFKNALELIDKDTIMKRSKGIVLASEEWHPGVIGVVASKLVEAYYKPTILISLTSGLGKGSARSIQALHIYETLKSLSEYLEGFGGHRLAAGLVIKVDKLESFRDSFFKLMDTTLTTEMLTPIISIDGVLKLKQITRRVSDELKLLMPFGTGNSEPVFVSYNVKLAEPTVLKHNVIRCKAVQDDTSIGLVVFNTQDPIDSLPRYANIAYYIRNNTFNGNDNVELVLKDIVGVSN
ncbi:MAG: single-stranded-DNA-specific exonuclease RecJ [bacterium]